MTPISQGLVPQLPVGRKTRGFNEKVPGLFARPVVVVCVAKSLDLVEECENPGIDGAIRRDDRGFVYSGSPQEVNDLNLDLSIGDDPSSIRRAFEAGWEEWLKG